MAKTGRFDKAQGILEQCRTLPDHQAILQEMQEIKESIRFEAKAAASTYYTMLFKDELHTRRRILLGGGVQVLQKLTGIDFIATNAPQMFALGGSTGDKLALLAGGSFISSTARGVINTIIPCLISAVNFWIFIIFAIINLLMLMPIYLFYIEIANRHLEDLDILSASDSPLLWR